MSRIFQSSSILLSLILAASGCAKKPALPGAVYAGEVSVYKTAEFDGAMGGESSGEDGSSESMSWFFNTTDPMDQVVAFYEQALPGATKESDEGEVTFTFAPQGAEPDEQVQVIVSDGRIQIHESTKPGKHKDADCYDKAMEGMGLGLLK